jgi:small subunit ribosomal protein S1
VVSNMLLPHHSDNLVVSDELRQSFAALLEESFHQEIKPSAIAIGEILKVDKDGLLVDIGGKSEGFVPIKEIPGCNSSAELNENYKVGQVHEFFIVKEVDEDVQYILSVRRVATSKSWDQLSELKEANTTVDVTVTGTTKGGILVNVMDLKGFIPASQLRLAKTLMELIGDQLPAKILEVDKNKNKLILSHRAAIFEQKAALRADTLSRLTEGDVVEGEIVKVTDFGVFVDIHGIDGLLPLSEITWRRIKHPSEVLSLGQAITVRVLTVDQAQQRISLSLKRLESDPWDSVNQTFTVGQQVSGRISKMLTSGVLAELTPGVEAYCCYDQSGKFYLVGDTYDFEIVSIAANDRRITLEYRGQSQPSSQDESQPLEEEEF